MFAELGVTHLFFAGYAGTNAVEPNLLLFANALDAVADTPSLRHVHLVEGTKWYGYGMLPGPFKTPAKETDPRCLADLFYYAQQDLLEAKAGDAEWTWSASRPHTVIGFSVGSKMNLALVIAVYASLCKERGTPLHFPGNQASFDCIYQMTDSALLARGIEHLATNPLCANRAVNITNGDFVRWRNLWPRIAKLFGLEPGVVRPMKLQDVMSTPEKAETWARLTRDHGLDASKGGYKDLVPTWGFADYVFHGGVDVMSDTGLSRRLGFLEFQDTEEMLCECCAISWCPVSYLSATPKTRPISLNFRVRPARRDSLSIVRFEVRSSRAPGQSSKRPDCFPNLTGAL